MVNHLFGKRFKNKKYLFIPFFFSCGKCRRYMKLIESRPSRLHCETCKDTYNLPQNGLIKGFKELKCPLDDFELVQFSGNNNAKVNFL